MKNALKLMMVVGFIAAAAAIAAPLSVTDVSSHSTPALVDQINTGWGQIETWGNASLSTSSTPVVTGLLTAGAISTTGAVTIAEGALTDSKVVSADIKDGEIVNADVNASAAIAVTKLGTGGIIPANSAASLTNIPGANITGNIPVAAISNAVYGTGALITNDVIVAGNTTNRWILAPVGDVYIVRSITGL
jgi:hypothetical protein